MLSSYLSNFRRTLGRNATKGKEYSFTSWATSSRATKVGFVHSFARFAQIEARRPRQELTGRAASDTRPDDTRRGPPAALERPTATSVRKLDNFGTRNQPRPLGPTSEPVRGAYAHARCPLPGVSCLRFALLDATGNRRAAGHRAADTGGQTPRPAVLSLHRARLEPQGREESNSLGGLVAWRADLGLREPPADRIVRAPVRSAPRDDTRPQRSADNPVRRKRDTRRDARSLLTSASAFAPKAQAK